MWTNVNVPFTLVHTGKDRRQIKNTDITKTNNNPEKNKQHKMQKQNYICTLVQLLLTKLIMSINEIYFQQIQSVVA